MMVRRVAVIGAGSSGLVCTKICVEEGLEPVCFESSDDIGGLWNFKESPQAERSSIYRSLVVNTSKEMMCFSDFPMPDHYPNYMHHSLLLQYFRLYAQHFNLLKYIHFKTTVKRVVQRLDFAVSGQWEVETVNQHGEEYHVFDAVMVCSGHYTQPYLPMSEFTGSETFTGRHYHSWEYKDAERFRGKRVLVMGIGNSGGDIAAEISRFAEKTFLSTRKGAWVIGRMSNSGLPLDMTGINRFYSTLLSLLPARLLNWITERALNHKYDHSLYRLRPKHRAFDRRPVINDELPYRILLGEVVMKPNIKGFNKSRAVFEDDTEEETDIVIFCTGYITTFPFLPQSLSQGPKGALTLYKRLFPPSLQQPTLVVMGLFQTKGPIMPVVEMQARWATAVFQGLGHLPPKDKMLSVIKAERKRSMKSYPCPLQADLQVDYIPYLDFMADKVGVKPHFAGLLLRDPVLWVKVFFGPCTPYQFRLNGPGQWSGARQAILSQWERVDRPFNTRAVPHTNAPVWAPVWLLAMGSSVLMAAFVHNKIKDASL
ncbi:flavin-containing monooxygenase 5-like [Eucyclogobius newberryi]|uniref:flavin-containing monooxygenase 5-like n=1 Tax=Eucyclogobius newberryi TaxID=166745 RepID=UPI003B5CFC20